MVLINHPNFWWFIIPIDGEMRVVFYKRLPLSRRSLLIGDRLFGSPAFTGGEPTIGILVEAFTYKIVQLPNDAITWPKCGESGGKKRHDGEILWNSSRKVFRRFWNTCNLRSCTVWLPKKTLPTIKVVALDFGNSALLAGLRHGWTTSTRPLIVSKSFWNILQMVTYGDLDPK